MLLEELDRTSTHVAGTRSRLANVQCLADCLSRVARATGPGSRAVRRELLDRLFGRATAYEQFFLVRLMTGELRQGALERIVVEAVARLPLDSAVLDGQVLALRPDGRPHPFQVTMSRFGSRLEVEAERAPFPCRTSSSTVFSSTGTISSTRRLPSGPELWPLGSPPSCSSPGR